MEIELYLIRHGETDWSRDDRFTGVTDVPLNRSGIDQARALASRLSKTRINAAVIYSSPFVRCVETAHIIGDSTSATVETLPDLRELDYGVWEGLPRHEVTAMFPTEYDTWSKDPVEQAPPRGETGSSLLKRVYPCITNLVTKLASEECKHLVIVAHKSVNRIFICKAIGVPVRRYRISIRQDPACLNILRIAPGSTGALVKLNDTCHYEHFI